MRATSGVVLYETLFVAVLFLCLLLGAHVAVGKFWNRRLDRLQQQRLRYDGVRPWSFDRNS